MTDHPDWLKRGYQFTHDRILDPDWHPSRGQKYVDGPKARMEVTQVTPRTIYYGYEGDNHSAWKLSAADFIARFGPTL